MAKTGGITLRRTPYELVFGPEHFEREIFPAIRQEAEARNVQGAGPEAFIMLGAVGNLLRGLSPGDDDGRVTEGPPPEAVQQYGALAWHAHRFWQAGRPVYAFSEDAARQLLGEFPALGSWELRPPVEAGYLQFPRNLLWARVDEDMAAEPVDGFHWTWLEANAAAGRAQPQLDLLLALGLRTGRAGLSVMEITATPPAEAPGHWGDLEAREDGADYANILPGGELQEYHGIVSVAEVLKLASRCFHRIAHRPDAIEEVAARETYPARTDEEEVASHLPFRAVRLPAEERR